MSAEAAERVAMALADAGHPAREAFYNDAIGGGSVHLRFAPGRRPDDEIIWRAFAIGAPHLTACWPCWSTLDDSSDCDHDPLTSEWPPTSAQATSLHPALPGGVVCGGGRGRHLSEEAAPTVTTIEGGSA